VASPLAMPRVGATTPHRTRFLVTYALLGGAVAASVVGLVFALGATKSHHTTVAWSSWKPAKGDTASMTKQIADHVGHRYRMAGGGQLVGVVASKPAVQDVQIKAIAVRSSPGSNSNISILPADKTEMFILCGLGSRCAIEKGKATTQRGRVLRRESLELALYTFKYVPGIDSIVAFLPPKPGSNPTYTLFLRKSDLRNELKQPLHRTLTRLTAPTPTTTDPKETPVIDRLTLPSLFQYSLTQSQDGSAILVLDPLALNG
jgi:hypothetical protein